MGATVYTYPGFVPGMIGAVVALLGLVLMARGWLARAQAPESEPVMPARVAIALLLSLVFCLVLLSRAHFVLATALFVATFTFLFADPAQPRARRLRVAGLSGAITAVVVFYVFQEIFLVRLP
jgi:Ca2+/Na+ antiporter